MGSVRLLLRSIRRRWVGVGAVAGVAVGALIGGLASGSSGAVTPARLQVLHPAPVFARPGRSLDLGAATECVSGSPASCRVTGAVAHVRSVSRWRRVIGSPGEGGYRFTVPSSLVGDQGFSYWLEFRTADGRATAYPPVGAAQPFAVSSTSGLTRSSMRRFSWSHVRRPDRRVLFLPYGSEPGDAGLADGGVDQDVLGPSSFTAGPDGRIYVVDWVNDRIEIFHRGRLERTVATPVHTTMDAAVGSDGSIDLMSLGTGATVYELASSGRTMGRYPVGLGAPARVVSRQPGPAVFAGPGQWLSVRSASGLPRSISAESATMTAATPLPGGSTTLSGEIDARHIAAEWTRPDGSRAGALIRLPEGVLAGTDYFVQPTSGGGAIVARGLWDDTHAGVGVLRLNASGRLTGFSLLPEPSTRQDARYSTVRWMPSGRILLAEDRPGGYAIESFRAVGR